MSDTDSSDEDETTALGWAFKVDQRDIVKRAAADGEEGDDAPFLFSGGAEGGDADAGAGASRRYGAPNPMEHSMAPPAGFKARLGAVYQMLPSGRFKELRSRRAVEEGGDLEEGGGEAEARRRRQRGGFELVRFLARFTLVFFHVCQGLLTGFSLLQAVLVFVPATSALLLQHYAFYAEQIRRVFFSLSAISTVGALTDWMQAVDDQADGGDPFDFSRAVEDDDEEGNGERVVEMRAMISGEDSQGDTGVLQLAMISLANGVRALTSGPIGVVLLLQFATYVTSIVGGAVESQMFIEQDLARGAAKQCEEVYLGTSTDVTAATSRMPILCNRTLVQVYWLETMCVALRCSLSSLARFCSLGAARLYSSRPSPHPLPPSLPSFVDDLAADVTFTSSLLAWKVAVLVRTLILLLSWKLQGWAALHNESIHSSAAGSSRSLTARNAQRAEGDAKLDAASGGGGSGGEAGAKDSESAPLIAKTD